MYFNVKAECDKTTLPKQVQKFAHAGCSRQPSGVCQFILDTLKFGPIAQKGMVGFVIELDVGPNIFILNHDHLGLNIREPV